MTIVFDASVWRKQRTLVEITDAATTAAFVRLTNTTLNISADYWLRADRGATIDVSDMVRAASSGSFTLQEMDAQGGGVNPPVTKTWTVVGDIDPTTQITPHSALLDSFRNEIDQPTTVLVPPHVMLADFGIPNRIAFAGVQRRGEHPVREVDITTPSGAQNVTNGAYTVTAGAQHVTLSCVWDRGGQTHGETRYLYLQPEPCGVHVASVQWRSREGYTKRAVWLFNAQQVQSPERVDLINTRGIFNVHKSCMLSGSLLLENLTAYDTWYYSDIVTSDDVRVSFDASDYDAATDTIAERCRVDVLTRSVTIPGDMDRQNLVIEIKRKEYDRI